MSKLEQIKARLAAKEASAKEAEEDQEAVDLEAIETIRDSLGRSNVAIYRVGHTPGLPLLVAVRTPNSAEVKRYQDTVKTKSDGSPGDPLAGASAIGAVTRVYPDDETFEALVAARPGIKVPLGLLALGLASGRAEAAGKG